MEFKDWFKGENHDLYDDPEAAMEEAWNAAIESAKTWRPMSEAPREGTPVLLKFKDELQKSKSIRSWASIVFVGRHRGTIESWSFAAPVGEGGIPDDWLKGWREI